MKLPKMPSWRPLGDHFLRKELHRLLFANPFYFIPMAVTGKKPAPGFGWSTDFDGVDARTRKARLRTRRINLLAAWIRENPARLFRPMLIALDCMMLAYPAYLLRCDYSRLVVIDCDIKEHSGDKPPEERKPEEKGEGGICQGLLNLEAEMKKAGIPLSDLDTLMSITPGGGYHFIFSYDYAQRGKLNQAVTGIWPCIDLKAGNCVMIAPGSQIWRWGKVRAYQPILPLDDKVLIKPLPAKLEDLLVSRIEAMKAERERRDFERHVAVRELKPDRPVQDADARTRMRADRYCARTLLNLRGAQPGFRHDELFKASVSIGGLCWATTRKIAEWQSVLADAGRGLGLPRAEAERTVHDGLEIGQARPIRLTA